MEDFPPSGTSSVVAAPIKDAISDESGSEPQVDRGDRRKVEHAAAQRPVHDASRVVGGGANVIHAEVDSLATVPETAKEEQPTQEQQDRLQQQSDTATTTAQPQPQHPVAPLKRFTSVNINKRFLEKTPSTSGASSSGGPLTGHVSGAMGGSAQRRGASPASARSPSTDRPAPSRLVTAKLTAVPQASTASTSGWLRTNSSSTPGTSAAPTPPSSSPQPSANGPTASHAQPASSTGSQQSKHRFGVELQGSQNGASASSTSSFPTQQTSSKPVWGKVAPPPSNVRGRDADRQLNDFPTAAEAAHGRRIKVANAQIAAETAAAQTAAQKQAMNETAAAFRGVHLDPKAHHWDEMEDEDSDFLAGVIEFGDGTQYKIEHKAESVSAQDHPSSAPTPDPAKESLLRSPPPSHPPVSKEERFGEDFDRSWPRAKTSPVHSAATSSLPPRIIPPPQGGFHHSPTDSPGSGSTHSPYDGTSPASRVLFNERSNRLEPWSNTKPRLGSAQASSPTARRGSREDHPPFGLSRQQATGREAPPHSHPNVQLLQKTGADSTWKGGSSRGFSHAPERGRWGAPPPRDEDRPREAPRRESMSSSEAAGPSTRELSRDRDAGRSRWDVATADHQRERDRRTSNASTAPPVLPQSLAQDKSRDAGRQLPPHLSRMPPPSVPPMRGQEMSLDVGVPSRRPAESPSASVRSQLSSASDKPLGTDGGVDKDSLVKDAMQLAIERAKRRKQEGEEEEKRRLEAAERARKKADALAVVQEEKKKNQAVPPTGAENKVLKRPPVQDVSQTHPTEINGIKVIHKPREIVDPGGPKKYQPANLFSKGLPRKSSIPSAVEPTPASKADSWRSKATPVASSPPCPRPASSAPLLRSALPAMTKGLELDLSIQPDENIEIVDFCDLGKLMGCSSSPSSPSGVLEPAPVPIPASMRAKRPIASDFFDDRPSSRERLSPVKGDTPSWRRPSSKPLIESPPQFSREELGTQTMPIFLTEELMPVKDVKDVAFTTEAKPISTPSSSPTLNRHSSQSDHASSNSTAQSVYVPAGAAMASRSPRTPSHFKEAPMSTLTDTMSRIKGALDGMQLQEPAVAFQLRESKEKEASNQRLPAPMQTMQTRTTEMSMTLWREHREPRSEASKVLSPPANLPSPRETFDVTCPDPPRTPKPAWNAFVVRLPRVSRHREPISRKQLHFWNLPHPGVRWDILSWEPPVEGMNKRELSRDEIFHRKYAIKGGKLRVLLPNNRIVHPLVSDSSAQDPLNVSSLPALVTAAGVKIKLPPNAREKPVISSSRTASSDRPRDSGVPSWRKSAMSWTQPKKDRQSPAFANRALPDHELNTTSRSPPPEPSTPLPQLPPPKNGMTSASSPASAHSATVSLPTGSPSRSKTLAPKRPSGTDVAFFRTSRGESGAENRKPLPRFTVTSELDRSGESASSPTTDRTLADNKVTESAQSTYSLLKGSPRNMPPAEMHSASLISSSYESKSADEHASGNRPMTPPSTHTSSAWGKSPLSFSLKESPARSAPDPEHLKAVWSQPSGRTTTTTSNSLKGIADDLPSIPFTVQDMKSEDGETPPPTAPAPPPSRLSLQEVTRAFQQVPGGPPPATSPSSRPLSYAPTPLLSSGTQQSYRSNQAIAMSLPPQHGVRPTFAPYTQPMVGHSPSPTLMYAPGITSPVSHHRMPVNGPSPPVAHPVWLPTPPPQPAQAAAFMRAGHPPPAPMMYPSPSLGSSPNAAGHMVDRRIVSPPDGLPPPSVYQSHSMDIQGHLQTHTQSPHLTHTHPVTHPVPHMHHVFSPPQHGQAPTMYAVPIGAGRGVMSRPGYEGMQQVPHLPPHNPGYQPVPPTLFSHPFHS